MVVVTEQGTFDLLAVEQFPGAPRVFCGNDVRFSEHAQRPKRNVFQVTYRRRDKVERSHARILAERRRAEPFRAAFGQQFFLD